MGRGVASPRPPCWGGQGETLPLPRDRPTLPRDRGRRRLYRVGAVLRADLGEYRLQSTEYGVRILKAKGDRETEGWGAGWLEYGWLGVGPKRITEYRVQITDLKGRG